METKKCTTGCISYDGNERYHHKDCPFYSDSFSKRYDDLKRENEELKAELEKIIEMFTWYHENSGERFLKDYAKHELENIKKENEELKDAILDIQRYDISSGISHGDHPCSILEIDKDENGEWIKYTDVKNLIK